MMIRDADWQALAPVGGRYRIDVLDVLRGIAILGIFFMNIPFMGTSIRAAMIDPRAAGWAAPDRWTWGLIGIVAEGTQRGVLEMLFGAGMMILTARAMTPEGPVAVADLYMRRTLWLVVFGIVHVFVLLWPGDILHVYALASLFLFPFRRMAARWLVILGLVWGSFLFVGGSIQYAERATVQARVVAAEQARAGHRPLTGEQAQAVRTWNRTLDRLRIHDKERDQLAKERAARHGALLHYARWVIGEGASYTWKGLPFGVAEAFSTMLIGIALYKGGVIQGLRSTRFYLLAMLAAYAFGMGARAIGVAEDMVFLPVPKTIWATREYARLAVSIGHICAVNLMMRSRVGSALLHPFRAAGRTAFSLYVCETVIGMWVLFPGFGFGLWDRFGWFGLAMVALAVQAGLLIAANLWMRGFQSGPLEWLWRSLAYWRRQPFRRHGAIPATAIPATVVGP